MLKFLPFWNIAGRNERFRNLRQCTTWKAWLLTKKMKVLFSSTMLRYFVTGPGLFDVFLWDFAQILSISKVKELRVASYELRFINICFEFDFISRITGSFYYTSHKLNFIFQIISSFHHTSHDLNLILGVMRYLMCDLLNNELQVAS